MMDPVKAGIIKTSTLLAEDRVLSIAMVLKNMGLQTQWVHNATFFYGTCNVYISSKENSYSIASMKFDSKYINRADDVLGKIVGSTPAME